MPDEEPAPTARPRTNRARLRRSGRHLVRIGAVLAALSLVVTLVAGLFTRSMLDHLQTNSAELLDGTATVELTERTQRTLYVTGGLVAPGELAPTPVDQISCSITGPDGRAVPFEDRSADRIGVDTVLARLQVIGHFRAQQDGPHEIECEGLGVVVAPEVEPASVLARIGGLALGSLGTILGLTMLLIGGVLLLALRRTEGEPEDDEEDLDDDAPPEEGADEWWEEGARVAPHARGEGEEEYVELTPEELAAFSDEEIEALVASGAIVFDDDEPEDHDEGTGPR